MIEHDVVHEAEVECPACDAFHLEGKVLSGNSFIGIGWVSLRQLEFIEKMNEKKKDLYKLCV